MKVNTYRSLLADLYREVGVDAAQLADDDRLVVEGIEISLAHEAGEEGGYLWICVDFGAVPDKHANRVYGAMLQSNLRAGGLDVGVFTLQPDGRAALVVRQPLNAALTGEFLARALLHYAAAAKGWIENACGMQEN